jgi:hypothetical protein
MRNVPGLARAVGFLVFELQQVLLMVCALQILVVKHVAYGAFGCSVIFVLFYSLSLLHLTAHDLGASIDALE